MDAKLDIEDDYERTPLRVAWQNGRSAIVKLLVNKTSHTVLEDALYFSDPLLKLVMKKLSA